MQQNQGENTRPSRRPFGPRLHQKENDNSQLRRDSTNAAQVHLNAIPWAHDELSNDGLPNTSGQERPKPQTQSRPLPPRPRNRLNDARRRPLPPTTNPSETHDVPFLFSSRNSQFDVHIPDPIQDPFGTQNGIPSDAPIWKSYMDEAQRQDKNTVANWNQSMDVILIFAGLFSAILTAFLIEFYHSLQPDPQQTMVNQLFIITQLLQAGLTNQGVTTVTSNSTISSDPVFVPSSSNIGVNILWFVSLTCSLGAAIGAMVIKQWLQFYSMGLSPNAYEYAHQHQYRLNSLVTWHVPSIISALPFIMLLSVGLFLAGLGLQLIQLHLGVALVVIGFMAIVLLCYVISLVLSLVYPACPYKTSAMVLLISIGLKFQSLSRLYHKGYKKGKPSIKPMPLVESLEVTEIRHQQPQLIVDSITWLLGVSQQEDAIHNALMSVIHFEHTPDMVKKLLSCNALEQLVQRATVPLPSLSHEFWNHLEDITPTHPVFLKFIRARTYMQILITIWHHPAYLALDRPPAVSENQDLERKGKITQAKKHKLKNQKHSDEESQLIDSHYSCILGDWLLFWRLLKQQHDNKLINLARKGYNLNIYADIVCTEVCHYHLQQHVTPLYLPQNRGAFIDLHEILQAVYNEGQENLNLEDASIWQLLDTLAYVFSGIDNAPLELQGMPRTWFSPSQSPSLMRKETVLLLVQLLKANRMRYNLISKKILLCLQMLLPVPMIASSRRSFFLQYQQENPSERELFEQMNITLEGLMKVFIPQLNHQALNAPQTESSADSHTEIASIALTQLVRSIFKMDDPTTSYNSILLNLPSNYMDQLLAYLLELEWTNLMVGQVSWLCSFLTEWYTHSSLSHRHTEACVEIFQKVLIPDWSEKDLQTVLKKIFNFLGELWKNPDSFYGNLVCLTLCNILRKSFIEGHKNKKILGQFIEMQALVAVGVFLVSDECSEECRKGWLNLTSEWQKQSENYTPSAQEVYQFEGLKNAATKNYVLYLVV